MSEEPSKRATSKEARLPLRHSLAGSTSTPVDPGARQGSAHIRTGLVLSTVQLFGMGLVVAQEVLSARLFGARQEMDGYLGGWIVPLTLVSVVGAALQNAITPHFVRVRATDGEEAAWQLTADSLWLGIVSLCLLGILGMATSRWVLGFTLAGGEQSATTVAEIIYPLGFVYATLSLAALLLTGVCAAVGLFIYPMVLSNLAAAGPVLCLALFGKDLQIYCLPAGLLAGGLAQAVLLLAALRRLGLRLSVPRRGALRRAAPVASDALAISISTVPLAVIAVQERHFASVIGPGTASHLFYSAKFLSAVIRFFGAGLSGMGVSLLSSYLTRGERDRFDRAFSLFFRTGFYLAGATMVGLALANQPLIQLLLERGQFSHADTIAVGRLLTWYGLYLPYGLAFPAVNAALLSQRKAWTLPVLNTIALTSYLGVIFVGKGMAIGQGVVLAAAYGVCYDIVLIVSFAFLVWKKMVSFNLVARTHARGITFTVVVFVPMHFLSVFLSRYSLPPFQQLVCLLLTGAASVVVALALIDREVLHRLLDSLNRNPRPTVTSDPTPAS